MKKLICAAALLLLIALSLSACSVADMFRTYTLSEVIPRLEDDDAFHSVNVSGIEITDRESGKKITVSGDGVATVCMNLEGATYSRSRGIKDGAKERYTLRFIMTEGRPSKTLFILSETEFVYDGYTYKSLGGKISLDFLERMFSE